MKPLKIKYLTDEKTITRRALWKLPDLPGELNEELKTAYITQNQLLDYILQQHELMNDGKKEQLLPEFQYNPDLIRWCMFGILLLKDREKFVKYKNLSIGEVINDLLDFTGEYYEPLLNRPKVISHSALHLPKS